MDMDAIAFVLVLFAGHRDLFKYVEKPQPPVVRKKEAVQTKVVTGGPIVTDEGTKVVRAEEVQPPRFPYRCIGTFGPASNPFAVFDGGSAILNVHAGEMIDGKFVVRAIGMESVTIGVEGSRDQRIAIGTTR